MIAAFNLMDLTGSVLPQNEKPKNATCPELVAWT